MAKTSPGVHFPPPLLFVIGYVAGWLIGRAIPLPILSGGRNTIMLVLGWLFVALALIVIAWALITFRRHQTGIFPNRPAKLIVTNGPYRFTRNPMYVGLTSLYIGISVLSNRLWPLLLLPIVNAVLQWAVIRREEGYLREAYGEVYEQYCRQVRRWL